VKTPKRAKARPASRARAYAAAADDPARLAAAYDWLRSSLAYLAVRRHPDPAVRAARKDHAARLIRETAVHLKTLAEQIDRGEI
jgi:hypothetical protein